MGSNLATDGTTNGVDGLIVLHDFASEPQIQHWLTTAPTTVWLPETVANHLTFFKASSPPSPYHHHTITDPSLSPPPSPSPSHITATAHHHHSMCDDGLCLTLLLGCFDGGHCASVQWCRSVVKFTIIAINQHHRHYRHHHHHGSLPCSHHGHHHHQIIISSADVYQAILPVP